MRMTRFILIVTAVTGTWLSETFAQAGSDQQLLQDDFVIAGVDGALTGGQADKWFFAFDASVSDGRAEIKPGQPLELLPSATLEQMTADAKTRVDTRYRLWGKLTKFEDRNYIFPTYFLALRKVEQAAGQTSPAEQARTSPAVNAPNDILSIPPEIIAKLQTEEPLPLAQLQPGLQLKQDTIFIDRTGFVIDRDNRFAFRPDGLGRNVEKSSLLLLPCRTLELALEHTRAEFNPLRVSVAAIKTTYKGQHYLLLQKATRVHTYGNFGR